MPSMGPGACERPQPCMMAAGHGKSHLLWQLACMRVPAPAMPGTPGYRRHYSWRTSDACSCHAHGRNKHRGPFRQIKAHAG